MSRGALPSSRHLGDHKGADRVRAFKALRTPDTVLQKIFACRYSKKIQIAFGGRTQDGHKETNQARRRVRARPRGEREKERERERQRR